MATATALPVTVRVSSLTAVGRNGTVRSPRESANNYCMPNIIYPKNDIIFHPLAYPLDSPQKIVPPVIDTGDDADDIAYTDPPTTDILSIHISDSDDIFTIQNNTDTFPISTE